MRGRLRAAVLLAAPALYLALWFFRPLAATMAEAWDADAWRWVAGPFVQGRLRIALWQATLSTALALGIAMPLAWFHHKRGLPLGRIQLAVHAAPFVLPVFVVVFGIQAVFGPGGWFPIIPAVGPLGAVVLAHAYYNYGFAARLLHAALERRPHRLEAAARLLGAPPRVAVLRTTVALLLPTFLGVALLVFLFAFTSFGVVLYLGHGEVSTLETLLYENLRGAFRRQDRAAVLAVVQLALNALLLLGYFSIRRRQVHLPREAARTPVPKARHHALSWLWVALGLLPALAVLQGAFQVGGRWSLEAWRALTDATHRSHVPGFDLGHAVQLSIGYALASATLALLLTALLGYGVRPLGDHGRRAIEAAAALPLGTSSLLIGLGFVLTFGIAGFLDTWTGRALIVIAHSLVAFPFTARAILPALEQHDLRLDEAARALGASPLGVVGRIHWPLLRAPIAAAFGLAIAMSLGDFGASLLLMNNENRSLSVWIDRHGGVAAFDPLVRAQADALAALLMALAAAAYILVERVRGFVWE